MYDNLAEFYDIFMDDVPYDRWIQYTSSFLSVRKKGVDVGCGTGKFTIALKKMGYDVLGMDVSEQMLSKAVQNATADGVDVTFVLQNAQFLEINNKVDFIVANCDVVNYLQNPTQFFKRAYSALNNGGILMFDISTEYKLKNVISNNVFTESNDKVTYIWENFPSKAKVEMNLTFFVQDEKDCYKKYTDTQTQYIHSNDSIMKMLKSAGFNKIKQYNFLSKQSPKDNSHRIHFVAHKEV